MSLTVSAPPPSTLKLDYSLTGENATAAIEKGLAEADWYQCPVPRATMRQLLQRRNGPALRNSLLWFALILASGWATCRLWGTWWAALPYTVYAVLYASTSDARWHEAGHGTAFKTDWMNNTLYEVASFMVMRESTVWRWSHTRHHSDTIIVGRDPEISVPRPADRIAILKKFLGLGNYPKYVRHIVLHSFGRMTPDEKTYIPSSEFARIYTKARIYLAIYVGVVALAIARRSVLPLMLVGFTSLFGSWLMVVYSMTQHAGMAEDVLDHRLNCRTVKMNAVNRFLYWNMNYHIEHHMYPLVPFHRLPQLHELIKDDCPPAYPSIYAAWREIVPAIWKQVTDPAHHVKRQLPASKLQWATALQDVRQAPDAEGWVTACASDSLQRADVTRVDLGKKTYAVCRDESGKLFAMDGICTHGNVHLSGGLVKGGILECPKHNGRFNLADGSPARTPICRGLATYPVQEKDGLVQINVAQPGGAGARAQQTCEFRVVSNRSVATFIKELVLIPADSAVDVSFSPGDYLQLEIPDYNEVRFSEFAIPEPYRSVWQRQNLFNLVSRSTGGARRNNYSLASNSSTESTLRFNVRIATPPPGQDCDPGVGSSYIFSLKPGDTVHAAGPFGDFHIKPTQREMVYIGGGAGMAPLRAHLSHLLETQGSARRISFWYGARSRQELFYDDYFRELEGNFRNFHFHPALSAPLEDERWEGHTGFIHEVLHQVYLSNHENPRAAEYYLCGPPMMIKACIRMLGELGVSRDNIAYDEF